MIVTVTPNPAIDWTITVPDFRAGAVNRVTEQRAQAAGKGVNVAVRLAERGHAVTATGFLGRANAAIFETLFAAHAIVDAFVRVDGETRTGIKIVDPAVQETTDVNFPGLFVEDVAALVERVVGLDATWVVLAGSLPPGVPATFYADLMRALPAGTRVALDTSGEPLRHAVAASPAVLKPTVHELSELIGTPLASRDEILAAVRKLTAELVVVSMGGEGALFIERNRAVLATPPPIEVHSTVGAGDAMVAGIVAARLAGASLEDTARIATEYSVAALTGRAAGAVTIAEALFNS